MRINGARFNGDLVILCQMYNALLWLGQIVMVSRGIRILFNPLFMRIIFIGVFGVIILSVMLLLLILLLHSCHLEHVQIVSYNNTLLVNVLIITELWNAILFNVLGQLLSPFRENQICSIQIEGYLVSTTGRHRDFHSQSSLHPSRHVLLNCKFN
jgi:hypothetical protein